MTDQAPREAAAVEDELAALVASVAAQAAPGEQVEAIASTGTSTRVRAYRGQVEDLTQATTGGVGVRVVAGGRQGFASAGSLAPELVAEALAEARDNVRFAAPDEANGLAEPDGVAPAQLDLLRPELATVPTADKVALALELERRATSLDPRIRGVRSAVYADSVGTSALATSTGLHVVGSSSTCYVTVLVLAGEGDATQTGAGSSVGRSSADLDLDDAAGRAVDRAVRMLGARQPPTQRTTVVLEPEVTASFLGIVGSTLGGEAVLKGRSPFADRVGERVASPHLVLVDDPTEPASLGADPHDGEGLASRRNELLADGVLQGYLHNTWSARRSGTASTASAVRGVGSTPGVGPRALALRPGPLGPEELLASLGDCLVVTEVQGLHSGVNRVSGDFSVGAKGVLVRGGEAAGAVRELTIASTLQRMLLDVVAVGSDLEWQPGGTGAPSLAIADVSLSGA
jgi:PmbA protein